MDVIGPLYVTNERKIDDATQPWYDVSIVRCLFGVSHIVTH